MGERNRSILRYEYKRFFSKKTWLWILLCILGNCLLWSKLYTETENDLVFKEIVGPYRGVSTPQKISDIYERTAYYHSLLSDYKIITNEYIDGNINDSEYQKYSKDYKYAKNNITGWEEIHKRAERFERNDNEYYFLYDVTWNKALDKEVSWIFVFLMVTLLIPYFYLDEDVQIRDIHKTYCGQKKIELFRLLLAIVVIIIFQTIWITLEYTIMLLESSVPDAMANISSLENFHELNSNVSIGQFFLIQKISTLIKRVIDVTLTYGFAKMIKNKILLTVMILVYLLATNFYYIDVIKQFFM